MIGAINRVREDIEYWIKSIRSPFEVVLIDDKGNKVRKRAAFEFEFKKIRLMSKIKLKRDFNIRKIELWMCGYRMLDKRIKIPAIKGHTVVVNWNVVLETVSSSEVIR